MRLFIAVNFTAAQRRRVHDAAEPLREAGLPVRWVEPSRFHVTLKFLGEVSADRREGVERILHRIVGETPIFDLTLRGFGAFPTIRRPQVLWLAVDPSPVLRCLKQDLEWGLSGMGFSPATRAFHPHVTLGRAKDGSGAGDFRGLDEKVATMDFQEIVPVKTVDLVRSRLLRGGPEYSILSRAEPAHPSRGGAPR